MDRRYVPIIILVALVVVCVCAILLLAIAFFGSSSFFKEIEIAPPILSRGTETPLSPSQSPTPLPTPTLEVLYQDDFSDPGSGWEKEEYETGSVGYKDGSYFVTSTGDGETMWGVANRSFRDLAIEVETTQISSGPENDDDYGVACRVQPDGDGYHFVISGDGYYGIYMAEDKSFIPIVAFTPSEVINRGDAVNRIQAVCDGTRLSLFVNGQQLAMVTEGTFASGDIALTATSYEDTGVEIHFDNLIVREPR